MSITLLAASSANASLISHDILFDDFSTTDVVFEKIGYFVVDTDKADSWGLIESWEEFQIDILGSSYKFFTEAEANVTNMSLFDHFEVELDPGNLFAGVEALSFVVTEKISSNLKFQGIFGFSVGPGVLDLFDTSTGLLSAAGSITLSAVDVPEPSMLLLFLTGLVGLRLKKRTA